MKRFTVLSLLALALSLPGFAQAACPAPTPGSPHVCLKWTASTTSGVTYNIYRASTTGSENYAAPLNATPLTTTFYYDSTVAVGSTYFYTVAAVGTGGVLSAPSPEASAQVPVPPASPSGLTPSID